MAKNDGTIQKFISDVLKTYGWPSIAIIIAFDLFVIPPFTWGDSIFAFAATALVVFVSESVTNTHIHVTNGFKQIYKLLFGKTTRHVPSVFMRVWAAVLAGAIVAAPFQFAGVLWGVLAVAVKASKLFAGGK